MNLQHKYLYVFFGLVVLTTNNYGKGPVESERLLKLPQESTPFFSETYKYSTITLKQGRVLKNIQARIDLANQETQILTAIGSEKVMTPMQRGTVREISYADTTEKGIVPYTFRTGFPPVDKQTEDHFYIVLADGRCSFLKCVAKKVTEKRNELSGNMIQLYDETEEYYFFSKGKMQRWKRDKDFVLGELSDKQEEVNQFLQSNKTNFRNVEQVSKLLNYYNSINIVK